MRNEPSGHLLSLDDQAGLKEPIKDCGAAMSTVRTQPELAGSVALVTGGGRGIGQVLARALAGAGAAVGLIARTPDQLAESVQLIEAAGGVAVAASADLGDPEAAATAVKKLRLRAWPRRPAGEQRRDLRTDRTGLGCPGGGLVAHRRGQSA